ncbi:UDP binding domain-containing protein [Candidatus Latescibacterota bacterium]
MKLMDLLDEKGAIISFYDPYIPTIPESRKYKKFEGMKSIELNPDTIKKFDAVLISTNHS